MIELRIPPFQGWRDYLNVYSQGVALGCFNRPLRGRWRTGTARPTSRNLRHRSIARRFLQRPHADIVLWLVAAEDDFDAGESLLLTELDGIQCAYEDARVIFVVHPDTEAFVEQPASCVLKK